MEWKCWSENTNLPHQLTFLNHQSAGTQNAGLIWWIYRNRCSNQGSGSEAFQRTNVTWDGLSYTIGDSMTNERGGGGVVGSMNSSLAQGGNNSLGHSTCTEEWNGSAWSDAAASNFQLLLLQQLEHQTMAMHTVDASSLLKQDVQIFTMERHGTGHLLDWATIAIINNVLVWWFNIKLVYL